jgi:hypothetical protein
MPARHEEVAQRLSADEIAAISETLAVAISEAISDEADAFGLATFCRRHGISTRMYYNLAQRGLAPKVFYIGSRVLVSKEAAAQWRAEREAANTTETA